MIHDFCRLALVPVVYSLISIEIDRLIIAVADSARILDVFITSDLSLDKHACRQWQWQCFFQLLQLRPIRCSLDDHHYVYAFVTTMVYRQSTGLEIDRAQVQLSPGSLQTTSSKLLT